MSGWEIFTWLSTIILGLGSLIVFIFFLLDLPSLLNNQPKNFLRKYNAECNSKGMLEGKDLNGLLAFLISDSSKLITGQNIIIDDGWSL